MFARVVLGIFLSVSILFGSLPKKVLADKYLLQAKQSIEKKDYASAQLYFEKILSLHVKVPNSFHYFYAKTLFSNQKYKETLKELDYFLGHGGDKSKHYVKSLELYTKAENKEKELLKIQKKEEEKVLLETIKNKKLYKEYLSNGTWIRDRRTGLAWTLPPRKKYRKIPQVHKRYKKMSLDDAKNYCENLRIGGYHGWKLPDMAEFTTINRFGTRPTFDAKKHDARYDIFWVKGYRGFKKDRNSKFKAKVGNYYVLDTGFFGYKSKYAYPLCVKWYDKSKVMKYFRHKYVVYNLNHHRLMMQDSFSTYGGYWIYDKSVRYYQAKRYCSHLNLAGYNDWRVPTKHDMLNYIPCDIDRHLYFAEKNYYYIYGGDGFFGSSVGYLNQKKCIVHDGNAKYVHGRIRCVRDVDKPKAKAVKSQSNIFDDNSGDH